MKPRVILGWSLIALPAVAMFLWDGTHRGWWNALMAWGVTALCVAIIGLGYCLLRVEKSR